MAFWGQAWTQARQVWQSFGAYTALPSRSCMEPVGQTSRQMPQPTQVSVTRIKSGAGPALWHLPDAAQKLLMRSTIRLRDDCNLILSRCQIFLDQHDFGILLLVQLYLLIHIERGQPVVNHLNNVNIADADAAFLAEQLYQLRSTAMAVPVGENHVEVIGMENSIVQKIPHHMGNLMLIDRGYGADGISGELQGFLSNDLGNTDEVLFQMLCNI